METLENAEGVGVRLWEREPRCWYLGFLPVTIRSWRFLLVAEAGMSVDTVDNMVGLIQHYKLLEPAQVDELTRDLAVRFAEPHKLRRNSSGATG